MVKRLQSTTRLKAYSILEVLITLALFGVLIAMLSNILLLNFKTSRQVAYRSKIREELSELVSLIQRDMRNADYVVLAECGNGQLINNQATVDGCKMSHVEEFVWVNQTYQACRDSSIVDINRICKIDSSGNVIYKTSDEIQIDQINFDILTEGLDGKQATIIITLIASAANPNWEVDNQVRQITVSTRNF